MIEKDAVLATENGFVVIDKINAQQTVRDYKGLTKLKKVVDGKCFGFLVETESFFIAVSRGQKFIVSNTEYKHADSLEVGDQVLTSEGFDKVTAITNLEEREMSNIVTESKIFIANGFVLITD
jgi:hypothetical protein